MTIDETTFPGPAGSNRPRRRAGALAGALLAAALLALTVAAPAGALPGLPRIGTGGATHVLPTSALLTGRINPNGAETTYFFRYGPTTAYGLQTTPASAGSGTLKIAVGQSVGGLAQGGTYHYKLIAQNPYGTVEGHDRIFKTRGAALVFEVPKSATDVFGTPVVLTGVLRGQSAAVHKVVLQASPFPYLEPFASIGVPGTTNATGRFSFRIANLLASTQLRLTTLDPLPILSKTITVTVSVRVSLHARTSKSGLVRLYGTISPAVGKAKVGIQLRKAIRPDKNENTTRWFSVFSTTSKRNGGNSSRFSVVVKVRHTGRYRAFVRVPAGPVTSGASSTVLLHAAPGTTTKK